MKTLKLKLGYALCMLLPVFVFCDAQAQIKDTLYQITCDGDTTGTYFVFERGQMPPEHATQNIMQLMFEYETDCYNDSTLLKHQHFMPEGETYCIVDWECLNESHYKDYWIHKEPTFQDFVRWVRKKYCR